MNKNDGWIEWGGGERNFATENLAVEVKFRDGEIQHGLGRNFYWGLDEKYPDVDIIAYRVIENDGREG